VRGLALGQGVDDCCGGFHRALRVGVDERQQGFGQSRQVPAGDAGLLAVGVAAGAVDGTEHRAGAVAFHEGAGAVVDGLARQRHVVGVHDTVDEADAEPARHEFGLALADGGQQVEVGLRAGRQCRVMAGNDVVGQALDLFRPLMGGEELEGADADMAGGDAGQHGAGLGAVAAHHVAGRHDGQRTRRRNAQGVHRLADQVLAQGRTECAFAVAIARKRRAAGTFERDVAALAVAVDHLAEQQGPPVAELRRELAELVAGVGLGDWLRSLRNAAPGQRFDAFRRGQRRRVGPQLDGQFFVQADEGRLARRRRLPANVELIEVANIGVVEGKKTGGWGVHRNRALSVFHRPVAVLS